MRAEDAAVAGDRTLTVTGFVIGSSILHTTSVQRKFAPRLPLPFMRTPHDRLEPQALLHEEKAYPSSACATTCAPAS